jgi:pilus assembly protein Flp/PilA
MSHSDDKEATMVTVMQRAAAAATVWGNEIRERCEDRARDERGQTAAEYMGVLLIVGLIIFAIVELEVAQTIAEAVEDMVNDISGGENPQES